MSKPDVTSDNAAVSDTGIAAENGGVGINNAVIADVGMALDALDGIAVGIKLEAFGSKGNTLIDLDTVAYGRGLAYYNTRAVIYEEILANGSAGVYVYSCFLMCVLGHNAREVWDRARVQLVRHAVNGDSVKAGIG